MPWARLDDQIYCHPKMQACDGYARALNVAGITYCSAQLTDGFIPKHAPRLIMAMAGFVLEDAPLGDCIHQLTEAGLWEPATNGYLIHDYLVYNPSRAQVMASRERNAARQQRHRDQQRESNSSSNGVTNGVTDTVSTDAPYPVPFNYTTPPKPPTLAGSAATMLREAGIDAGDFELRTYWPIIEGLSDLGLLRGAIEYAAKKRKANLPYIFAVVAGRQNDNGGKGREPPPVEQAKTRTRVVVTGPTMRERGEQVDGTTSTNATT